MTNAISDFEIKIITLTNLAESANLDTYFSFFKDEEKETILLLIEGLIRKNILSIEKGKIKVVSDKYSNAINLNILIKAIPFDLKSVTNIPKPCGVNQLCSTISLCLNNQTLNEGVFPYLEFDNAKEMVNVLKDFLLKSELLYLVDDRYVINLQDLDNVVLLSSLELAVVILQTLYNLDNTDAVLEFLSVLKKNIFNKFSLESLLNLFFIKHSLNNYLAYSKEIIEKLIILNILTEDKNNETYYYLNPDINKKNTKADISCDSDFTITINGDVEKIAKICIFATIVCCDNVSVWSITKNSFFTALDSGLSIKDIQDILCFKFYDQIFNQWEQSYSRLKLYEGIVVQCSDDLDKVFSSLETLQPFIIKKISPCVYLFKKEKSAEWKDILKKALDLSKIPATIKDTPEPDNNLHYTLPNTFDRIKEKTNIIDNNNFKQIKLTEKETSFITSEVLFKIFESFYEESAEGMDFNRKFALIKAAIKNKKTIINFETLNEKYIGYPLEILKTAESENIVKAKLIPSGKEDYFKISSMYKIKVLKLTVFPV